MAAFLLKRLLHGLLALWLISTLIFFLSRLLPGSFAAQSILKEPDSFYSQSVGSSREANYQAYLRRTGQHLPLFYLSIHSSAEPDTLRTIFPESDRLLLQQLAWHFGNWPQVAVYFQSLKNVESNLEPQTHSAAHALLRRLHATTDPETISSTALAMHRLLDGEKGSEELKAAALALVQTSQQYRVLVPELSWHGRQNQYHIWLTQVAKGDFGNSFRDNRAVLDMILTAIGTTWWVLFFSMLISTILALELSILFVRQRGRIWRRILLPFLFFADRIPVFILALLLLIFFASPDFLQLFPVYGMGYYHTEEQNWAQQFTSLLPFIVLPTVSLIVVNLPYLTNQFYNSLGGVAKADYIRTAKAKGLSEGSVIRRHMLRNALFPIITLISDFLPALVAGVVVVETIFAIPGIGRLLVESVLSRDYPVLVGVVMVVALFKVISHLVSDLFYSLADPRIRLAAE